MSSRSPETASGSRSRWLWPVGGAVLVLLALGLVLGGNGLLGENGGVATITDTAEERAEADTDPPLDLARRQADDPAALGAVDAPLAIVEYSDYRCPFCGVFAREVMPGVIQEYIDRGDVRFEWRDLPVFGEASVLAATAGRAAGAQGRFWEFNEAVYAGAPQTGHPNLDEAALVAFAEEAGVPDLDRFRADLTNPELIALVERDAAEARAIGIGGTPFFLIGDEPISGAQPEQVFRAEIDRQLERAGK